MVSADASLTREEGTVALSEGTVEVGMFSSDDLADAHGEGADGVWAGKKHTTY